MSEGYYSISTELLKEAYDVLVKSQVSAVEVLNTHINSLSHINWTVGDIKQHDVYTTEITEIENIINKLKNGFNLDL